MSTERICYHAEMTLHLKNIKTAGFHMTSAKIQTTKLLILVTYLGAYDYLNSSCIRKK